MRRSQNTIVRAAHSVANIRQQAPRLVSPATMIGGVASSSLRGADLDDDGVITADEARGTHYQRRLGAQIHQPTVKLGAGVATTRYTPAQEKAIARLLHSREVWSQYAEEDQQAQEEAKQAAKAARREKAGEQISSGTFSVWQAARLGQVEVVQRFIEDNDFDIRKHNTEPVGYGDTLLHTACWHGHGESRGRHCVLQRWGTCS